MEMAAIKCIAAKEKISRSGDCYIAKQGVRSDLHKHKRPLEIEESYLFSITVPILPGIIEEGKVAEAKAMSNQLEAMNWLLTGKKSEVCTLSHYICHKVFITL